MKVNEITREIIGAAIEVHRALGPGKPEAAYEAAMARELTICGLEHRTQRPVPVIYKGIKLDCGYRLDLLVSNTVVGEIKAVEAIIPVHSAQVLTYLKLGGWKIALLLNFNVAVMKEGVRRLVLGLEENAAGSEIAPQQREDTELSDNGQDFLRITDCGDAQVEAVASEVIAAAIEVHRALGPGLLLSAYEECFCHELRLRGVPFERRRPLPLCYKGINLPEPDLIELIVDGRVILRPLAVGGIEIVHEAQLLSQLRLGEWPVGFLINFNSIRLVEGLRRLVSTRNRISRFTSH